MGKNSLFTIVVKVMIHRLRGDIGLSGGAGVKGDSGAGPSGPKRV